jgi:hypothetical protein
LNHGPFANPFEARERIDAGRKKSYEELPNNSLKHRRPEGFTRENRGALSNAEQIKRIGCRIRV